MSTLPFTLYIVYHKILYEENIEGFSEELKDTLCWVAVNEQIEKQYPEYTNGRLIKEWEMKNYSPMYQMLHWQQNSFFHHLYYNQELIKTKYIGFAQYDQKLIASGFEALRDILKEDNSSIFVGCFPYPFEACCEILSEEDWEEVFLKPYNAYARENHTIEKLKSVPVYLFHTFLLPYKFYREMQEYLEGISHKIQMKLKNNIRHLAGTLERAYGLYISCGILEKRFTHVLQFNGIELRDEQRTADPIRGVAGV